MSQRDWWRAYWCKNSRTSGPVPKEYGLLAKVFCIVAENAGSNGTMADALGVVCQNFKQYQNLHVFVAHFINLVTQDALKELSRRLGKKGPVPGNLVVLLEPM